MAENLPMPCVIRMKMGSKNVKALADDLIHRARAATAQGLCQKLGRFGTRAVSDKPIPHSVICNDLSKKNL